MLESLSTWGSQTFKFNSVGNVANKYIKIIRSEFNCFSSCLINGLVLKI